MERTLTYRFGERLRLDFEGKDLSAWPTPWGALWRASDLAALAQALKRRGAGPLTEAWAQREILCPDLWDFWLTALALPLAALRLEGDVTIKILDLDLEDLESEIGLWADQMIR